MSESFTQLAERMRARGAADSVTITGEVQKLPRGRDAQSTRFELIDLSGPPTVNTSAIQVWCAPSLLEGVRQGSIVQIQGPVRLSPKDFSYAVNATSLSVIEGEARFTPEAQRAAALRDPGVCDTAKKKLASRTEHAGKRLPQPTLPARVAFIGPRSGETRADIERILDSKAAAANWTEVSFGKPKDIAAAIRAVDPATAFIVLYRGGGGWRDWVILNDAEVLNAVANSTVPLITAIGHEGTDTTVGWLAYGNFNTPTEVAKRINSLLYFQSKTALRSRAAQLRTGLAGAAPAHGGSDRQLALLRRDLDEERRQTARMRDELASTRGRLTDSETRRSRTEALRRYERDQAVYATRALALHRIRLRSILQAAFLALACAGLLILVPELLPHEAGSRRVLVDIGLFVVDALTSSWLARGRSRALKPARRPTALMLEIGTSPWFAAMENARRPREYRRLNSSNCR